MNRWICLLLLLATIVAPRLIAQSPRFVLAIVRYDGGMVPFASYDGGRWNRAWPEADEAIDAPRTIDDVNSIWRRRGERVPRLWHLWPLSGASPREARVSGLDVAEAHCQGQVTLKTNLPAVKGDRHLKLGVAIDSDLPINSIEKVQESEDVWKTAARQVVANLIRLEASRAQTGNQQLPRETPSPIIRMTALYREGKTVASPLYFVAEKKYRTPMFAEQPFCERLTIMTGWLVPTTAGSLALRNPKIFLTDCDAKEVRTALPLAAVHVANQLFWVLQEHGYEDESYLIAEIRQNEIRYPIQVNGGGC